MSDKHTDPIVVREPESIPQAPLAEGIALAKARKRERERARATAALARRKEDEREKLQQQAVEQRVLQAQWQCASAADFLEVIAHNANSPELVAMQAQAQRTTPETVRGWFADLAKRHREHMNCEAQRRIFVMPHYPKVRTKTAEDFVDRPKPNAPQAERIEQPEQNKERQSAPAQSIEFKEQTKECAPTHKERETDMTPVTSSESEAALEPKEISRRLWPLNTAWFRVHAMWITFIGMLVLWPTMTPPPMVRYAVLDRVQIAFWLNVTSQEIDQALYTVARRQGLQPGFAAQGVAVDVTDAVIAEIEQQKQALTSEKRQAHQGTAPRRLADVLLASARAWFERVRQEWR